MAIIIPPIIDDCIGEDTEVKRIENLAQPIKQYTAEDVAVNLNVYTGKPIIMHNDMCIGTGNYQIPVSHVYRDDLVNKSYNLNGDIKIGFGDGWKLNLHQYVYPYQASYNYAGFSSGDYVYIDDVGYKHRFVKYKTEDGFDVYYDADGTGLRLKLLASGCEVYNDVSKLLFDPQGRLIEIVSPFNNSLNKIIVYENNKLTKVYVDGKSSRELQFTYNGNLLDEIKCASHANTLKFTYDTTSLKLTSVDLVNGNTSKNIATYVYNIIGRIMLAYDAQKKQGVKLEYDVEKQVSTVTTGFIDTETLDISALLHCDSYTYATGKNNTEVTNEKSITLAYNFDLNGRVCGTLEKETSGGLTNYRTLQKGTGWSLSTDSPSSVIETINGKTNDYVTTSLAINSERVSAFKGIFGVDENGNDKPHKYTDRFMLSFWLKTTTDTTGPTTASLTVSTVNGAHDTTHSVKLRNLRTGAWQQVSIPVYFDKNPTGTTEEEKLNQILARKENITGMTIGFGSLTNVYVSDIRITVGAPAQIMVDGVVFKDQAIACITSGFDYTVLSDSFMTESDLYTTFKNKYLAIGNEFDLVYCNGTKVKQVYDFGFEKATGVIIPFTIAMQSLPELNQIDTPNYFIQSKTRTAENKWTVSETRYKYYYVYKDSVTDVIINKSHYEQKQSIGQVESISANLPDSASYKYVQVYGNGLQREQRDEYGLITKYTHDNYGNVVKVSTYNEAAPNGEKLETTYTYDDTGELLTSITENGITQRLTYVDAPFIQLAKATIEDNQTTKYAYSNDLTQLKKVAGINKIPAIIKPGMDAMVGGTIDAEVLRNNLTYDGESGRLYKVSDQAGREYEFGYNNFGELSSCKENVDLIAEKIITRGAVNDVITEKRHRGFSEESIVTTLDKYGRVTKIQEKRLEDDLNKVEFEYQDVVESPACAQVCRIKDYHTDDPYNPYTAYNAYQYNYDENNNLVGYTVKDSNNIAKLIVTQTADNTTTYDVPNEETRTSSIIYDNQSEGGKKYITPRIVKTVDRDNNFTEIEKEFEPTYVYDNLGRLKEKHYVDCRYDPITVDDMCEKYEYETGTTRLSKSTYKAKISERNIEKEFSRAITYNSEGNINRVVQSGIAIGYEYPRVSSEDFVDVSHTTEYTYDNLNRITNESNTLTGSREYVYNSNGTIQNVISTSAEGVTTNKTFDYTNGRKTKVGELGIDYDNYGNLISIGQNKVYAYDTAGKLCAIAQSDDPMSQIYRYNYQGGLYRKVTTYNDNTEVTKNYLLDGTKILGEDWSDGTKLRYFYDAQGICGMRYNGVNYNFIRDEQGNVSKIMNQFKMIGEYIYDAWGNCTPRLISIHDDDISNMPSEQKEDELFVLDNNPFRWKGCYFDVDAGLYYINGRHYSPELMQYFEADTPANVLSGASTVNSLDRNAITIDNCIGLLLSSINILPFLYYSGVEKNKSVNNISDLNAKLRTIYNLANKMSSYLSGSIDGLLRYADRTELEGLQTSLAGIFKWLRIAGIFTDIVSSAYDNYVNPSFSTAQKVGSFALDSLYILGSAGLSYAVGSILVKGAVALGSLAGGFIGGIIVITVVVAGTVFVTKISTALDNWWERKKKEWLN